jgi:hypothetical protein
MMAALFSPQDFAGIYLEALSQTRAARILILTALFCAFQPQAYTSATHSYLAVYRRFFLDIASSQGRDFAHEIEKRSRKEVLQPAFKTRLKGNKVQERQPRTIPSIELRQVL